MTEAKEQIARRVAEKQVAIERITLPVRPDVARALVEGCTEKPGGVNPSIHFRDEDERPIRAGDIPLSLFRGNEEGDRYDGTVDPRRAAEYVTRDPETAPPVVGGLSTRSGELNILDGGHRISAARARGDVTIRALVLMPRPAPERLHAVEPERQKFWFREASDGAHHGQIDSQLTIHTDTGPAGLLDYSVFDGVPAIQMIHVAPAARRQGYATRLLCELQRMFPLSEIEWGYATAGGAALQANTPTRDFANATVAKDIAELERLRAEREAALALLSDARANGQARASSPEMIRKFDALNAMHDAISDLEAKLTGGKASKRMIDIDACEARFAITDTSCAAAPARPRIF